MVTTVHFLLHNNYTHCSISNDFGFKIQLKLIMTIREIF